MADNKTILRELSVATAIGLLIQQKEFTLNDLYDPNNFLLLAKQVVKSNLSSADKLKDINPFTEAFKQIINNGYNLALEIYSNQAFNFSSNDVVTWQGNDSQKIDPVDITIGNYGFSLKEESFILENMGLYQLMNCYTGSKYKRGLHIFNSFARNEYEVWFSTTWNEMIKYLNSNGNHWHYQNIKNSKTGSISLNENIIELTFSYNGSIEVSQLPLNCLLSDFEKDTTAKTRENVFSKFINSELGANKAYIEAKKKCSIVASDAVAKELNENLNYKAGLSRFLRIHDYEYYYAKTTSLGITIYRVPSKEDFGKELVIESITGSVPTTQANILTTIKNKSTGKTLTLRNECRFSHGQFNGTPEAKMYYERGSSLLTIYEDI